MKKVLASILVAVLVLSLFSSALALDVAYSLSKIGSNSIAVFSVEGGPDFKLRNNESKTVKTSEGRYTFYGDGTYHRGTKAAKKYLQPIYAELPDHPEEPGRIVSIDPVSTLIANEACYMNIWDSKDLKKIRVTVPTSDIKFRDYENYSFAFVFPKSGNFAPLSAGQNDDSIADILAGSSVLVVEKKNKYWKVETGELTGWINANYLVEYTPYSDLPTAQLEEGSMLYGYSQNPIEYKKTSKPETVQLISFVGEYSQVIVNHVRYYVNPADLK